MLKDKLTQRQINFVDAFLETGNGAEACRRAGYKNIYSYPSRLLSRQDIQQALQERKCFLEPQKRLTKDRILSDLETISKEDKSKPSDKVAAHALICKILGYTRDNPVQQVSIMQLLQGNNTQTQSETSPKPNIINEIQQ